MIKASDLRIGNCIWDDTKQMVKFVNHRVISDLASSAEPLPYSPILLTPEWLERCGFKYEAPYYSIGWFVLAMNTIREGSGDYDGFIFKMHIEGKLKTTVVRSLHQLQNFYFALTSEELTIKK